MKILIINKFCPLHPKAGGAEKNLLEIFSRIGETHEVMLLSAMFPGAAQEETYRNIHICRIGSDRSENVIRIHIILFFLLGKYLKRLKPDILFEDVSVIPFFSPIFFRKQKKIAMIHGWNGRYMFYSQRFLFSLIGYAAELCFLLLYKKETVIVVSEWMKEKLLRHGFRNIRKVLNGADESFFSITKSYSQNPSVLFLGRLEGRKGIDLFLKTFPFVKKEIPSVKYIIAGRRFLFGEPRWLKHTIESFEKIYPKNEVEFMGYVPEKQKRELLSASWLFTMPSRIEGYGIAAIEANSTGTFVIGNDTEGLREVIRNRETGALVDCHNTEEFSKKIVEWLNIAKLQAQEKKCKEWASTHSWEKSAKEIELLLLK